MKVTVTDCLKLPSFEGAKVIAGMNGLSNPVENCSVLEWADFNALKKNYFENHEFIITSFFSIKDDINSQCSIIRRFKEVGSAGLALYYVGTIITEIDPQVIATANQLDYPVIVMANNRDIGYGEAITDIMELVFLSKTKETQFYGKIIQDFAILSDSKKNYTYLLKLLSEQLKCSLVLCNPFGDLIAIWCYEGIKDADVESLITKAYHCSSQLSCSITENSKIYMVDAQKISKRNNLPMILYFINTKNRTKQYLMFQAVEVISAASEIWHLDLNLNNNSKLLRSIINNDSFETSKALSALRMDMKTNGTFCYIRLDKIGNINLEWMQLQRLLKEVKRFGEEQNRILLLDAIDEAVVVLIQDAPYAELTDELMQELIDWLLKAGLSSKIAWIHVNAILKIQSIYQSIEQGWDYVTKIYPSQRVYNIYAIYLAVQCLEIVNKGRESIDKRLEMFQPLYENSDIPPQDLLNTIEVFLLDAKCSNTITANLLYVHVNTVKYRMKKVKEKLGETIFELPDSYYLYIAVALKRILNTK